MDLNAFFGEDPPDLVRGVGVLSAHQLSPGLNDGHLAAEATVGLRQFEAGISAADHDQMRRQDVEFERFDMGHRFGGLEAWNIRNSCVRSQVDEDPGPRQRPRPAVVQTHFERIRRNEAPTAHDQFGAAFLIVLQMRGDLRFDHVALARNNLRHVDLDGARCRPELRSVTGEMRNLGATDLALARHARDIGAGAADPPALDDRGPSSRLAPYARLSACPLFHCRGSERHSVRVETCGTSSCVWEAGSSPSMIASLESGISQTPIAPTRRRGAISASSSPAMIDGSTYGDHTGFVTGDRSDTSRITSVYGLGMGVDSQETNCTFGPRFAQMLVNKRCGVLSCPFCVTS